MKISGRIIQNRNIRVNTENNFSATYKGCDIDVSDDHGHGKPKYNWLTRFDITVTGTDGSYLVNTYNDHHNIKDAIREALEGACL